MPDGMIQQQGSLTESVIRQLAERIDTGLYGRGDKLPSEQALCREFGVSRTVVREAMASLRLGGRLIARQGVGVFVPEEEPRRVRFEIPAAESIQDARSILELRLAVETEAVALATQRRTPKQLTEITAAYDRFNALDHSNPEALVEADFAFHLAIARATGNGHFPRLLEALGPDITLDLALKHGRLSQQDTRRSYLRRIAREHGAILAAITQGNASGARGALKRHLKDGLLRYTRLTSTEAAR